MTRKKVNESVEIIMNEGNSASELSLKIITHNDGIANFLSASIVETLYPVLKLIRAAEIQSHSTYYEYLKDEEIFDLVNLVDALKDYSDVLMLAQNLFGTCKDKLIIHWDKANILSLCGSKTDVVRGENDMIIAALLKVILKMAGEMDNTVPREHPITETNSVSNSMYRAILSLLHMINESLLTTDLIILPDELGAIFCKCNAIEHCDLFMQMIQTMGEPDDQPGDNQDTGFVSDLFVAMFTEWTEKLHFGSKVNQSHAFSITEKGAKTNIFYVHMPLFSSWKMETSYNGTELVNTGTCLTAETGVLLQYFKLFSILQRLYIFETMEMLTASKAMSMEDYMTFFHRIFNPQKKPTMSRECNIDKFRAALPREKIEIKKSLKQLKGILIGTLPRKITELLYPQCPMSFLDYWLNLMTSQIFIFNITNTTRKYKGTSVDNTKVLKLIKMTAVIEANLIDQEGSPMVEDVDEIEVILTPMARLLSLGPLPSPRSKKEPTTPRGLSFSSSGGGSTGALSPVSHRPPLTPRGCSSTSTMSTLQYPLTARRSTPDDPPSSIIKKPLTPRGLPSLPRPSVTMSNRSIKKAPMKPAKIPTLHLPTRDTLKPYDDMPTETPLPLNLSKRRASIATDSPLSSTLVSPMRPRKPGTPQ